MRGGSDEIPGDYGGEDATEAFCAGEDVVQGVVEDIGHVAVRDDNTFETKDHKDEGQYLGVP